LRFSFNGRYGRCTNTGTFMIRYRTTLLGCLYSSYMIIFVMDLLRMRIFALRERMPSLTFSSGTGTSSVATQTSRKISVGIFVAKLSIFSRFLPDVFKFLLILESIFEVIQPN
jgi:hypothetical protein